MTVDTYPARVVNGALATLTAVCGALGLAGLYTGLKRRAVSDALSGVAPSDIRSIDAEEVVEVEGTAHPVDDPLEAPLTGDEAVVVSWRVEEWDERGDAGAWREIGRGIRTTPFEVRDATGSIVVDVDASEETAGTWSATSGVTATRASASAASSPSSSASRTDDG